MTITKEVQGQLFSAETKQPHCIPTRTAYPLVATVPMSVSTATSPVGSGIGPNGSNGAPWTEDEHARFLLGLELFPSGPWKAIANCVGTRTARQTMSHAQKYRQKIKRRQKAPTTIAADISAQQHLQQFNEELAQQQHIDAHWPTQTPAVSTGSPISSFMTDGLSELHLTSEQIDEIIVSLFDDDDQPRFLTGKDLEWLMTS